MTAAPDVPAPHVSPGVPAPGWRALLALLAQLPQPGLSRAFGRLADVRIPRPMRGPLLGGFVRAAGLDMSEAERPIDAYASLNELFTRRLRPGVRSWPSEPEAAGSPVDAIVGTFGPVHDGTAIQAKGRHYAVDALLDDTEMAGRYDGGQFLTLYLSPRHYHRIHAPCDGALARARHVPGALLPVNAAAVAHIDRLFPRNERVICYLDGRLGCVAVVAVGAYNVGRISIAFDASWGGAQPGRVGNRRGARAETRTYEPPVSIARGDEIMAFQLGSTVIVLLEPGRAQLTDSLREGDEVRLGQRIARAA